MASRPLPPSVKAGLSTGLPHKGFAFPHQQGATLSIPQKWSCPNCGGDCFGSMRGAVGITYYCHGNSLGTQSEQTPGCGYWETAYEPRRQGIK